MRCGVPIILTLIALAGCAAGNGPGEACAVAPDCREDLVCFDGECTAPGSCPTKTPLLCDDDLCCPTTHPACCNDGNCYVTASECRAATCKTAGTSCRLSMDCCAGLTCQRGTCDKPAPRPVCGNGRCETGETQANCCTDCGCPAGSTCRAGTCGAAGTVLNWTVSNRCLNGADVQFRFFSQNRPVAWPGGNLVYVLRSGQTVTQPLACNPGEQICFGADQPDTGLFWGVGIDDTEGCADCCFICANASVSYGPLICN